MGCGASKQTEFNLSEEFKTTGMMQPWSEQYENEFEKQVYMAVNIFRSNPPRWVPIIKETYDKNPTINRKSEKELTAAVKTMTKMPGIVIDNALNQAVRKNNVAVTTVDTRSPTEGGNIAAL